VTLARFLGTENMADLGTKHVNGKLLEDLLGAMSVFSEFGVSTLALRASGEVKA